MSSANSTSAMNFTLEVQSCPRAVEFVAFDGAVNTLATQWPRQPGAVLRGADAWPQLLHFAPARWLAPAPDSALEELIAASCAAGTGTAIDVGGKWTAMALDGPGAARALAATIDAGAVLEARGCAAVELFDCPALLASVGQGFRIYVRSSYAAALRAALELQGLR